MNKLENKYNELENENLLDDTEEIVDLPIERKNKFQIIWQTIKKFLFKSGEEYQRETEK